MRKRERERERVTKEEEREGETERLADKHTHNETSFRTEYSPILRQS